MFVGRNSIAKLLDFKTSDFEYTVILLYKKLNTQCLFQLIKGIKTVNVRDTDCWNRCPLALKPACGKSIITRLRIRSSFVNSYL